MSTLWTPGGEHPVGKPSGSGAAESGGGGPGAAAEGTAAAPDELAEQLAVMRDELANAPAEVVVANHCYGLFELAALYLSQQPARLPEARLAIDALAGMLGGLEGRLGDAESQLREGLSQLRLAYVQIDGAERAGADVASGAGANGGTVTTDEGGVGPQPPDPDG